MNNALYKCKLSLLKLQKKILVVIIKRRLIKNGLATKIQKSRKEITGPRRFMVLSRPRLLMLERRNQELDYIENVIYLGGDPYLALLPLQSILLFFVFVTRIL